MLYLLYKIQEGVETKFIQKHSNRSVEKGIKKFINYIMTNYREEERLTKFKTLVKDKDITWIGGEFVNAKTHLDFKCNVCGTKFNKVPDLIRTQDYPCPTCSANKKHEKVLAKVKPIIDKRMKDSGLSEDFEVYTYPPIVRDPATFIHKPCGNKIHTSLQNLIRTTNGTEGIGTGCEYCSGTHTYTENEIKDYFTRERPTYTFISSRMSSDHHLMVTVRHDTCGNKSEYRFNYFMRGNGCSLCDISAGEDVIKDTLDKIGIEYVYQKAYDDLVGKGNTKLPYDFYLPSLNLIIEYDGTQHYVPLKNFGGEESFANRRDLDRKKDVYAVNNGITIARIPYTIKGLNLIKLVNSLSNKSEPFKHISSYIVNKK